MKLRDLFGGIVETVQVLWHINDPPKPEHLAIAARLGEAKLAELVKLTIEEIMPLMEEWEGEDISVDGHEYFVRWEARYEDEHSLKNMIRVSVTAEGGSVSSFKPLCTDTFVFVSDEHLPTSSLALAEVAAGVLRDLVESYNDPISAWYPEMFSRSNASRRTAARRGRLIYEHAKNLGLGDPGLMNEFHYLSDALKLKKGGEPKPWVHPNEEEWEISIDDYRLMLDSGTAQQQRL